VLIIAALIKPGLVALVNYRTYYYRGKLMNSVSVK